ncbi:MAG: hypothetical protein HN337_09015 [Deltaproteobacteria bacterium]|jgi:hypothetical protein|nr:hypothetical protein [Deltaproteobacteria bacterium]
MKKYNWQLLIGIILIMLSAVFYYIHYFVFHDLHHIFIYLIGDIAFVFIEVLLVTLVIHTLLAAREKRLRLKKLDMIIGAFFSEVGIDLIGMLSEFNPNTDGICEDLVVDDMWTDKRFAEAQKTIKVHKTRITCKISNLESLKTFLSEKKGFFLQLLQNPTLLEHEIFTDLLWGIFHIAEELNHRANIKILPEADYEHLAGDIERVYALLISEWLIYMKHLRDEYPYLFSLAIRTNPFRAHCEEDEA